MNCSTSRVTARTIGKCWWLLTRSQVSWASALVEGRQAPTLLGEPLTLMIKMEWNSIPIYGTRVSRSRDCIDGRDTCECYLRCNQFESSVKRDPRRRVVPEYILRGQAAKCLSLA